jgi:UDP-3-O-[3-hydroxymyristoyl] N-acetylglucosamine deacetylase
MPIKAPLKHLANTFGPPSTALGSKAEREWILVLTIKLNGFRLTPQRPCRIILNHLLEMSIGNPAHKLRCGHRERSRSLAPETFGKHRHRGFMTRYTHQRTLGRPVSCSGVGVHSGKAVNLTLKPAPENHGIRFVRTDLPGTPQVKALFNRVVDTSLATVIGEDGCIVSTIEHLMASLAGFSIDNALVEIDAYEMPILDGSAARYAEMIRAAGAVTQSLPRCFLFLKEAIELEEDGKFVGAYPSESFSLSCTIEYDHPLIGQQNVTVTLDENVFETEIAPARTFGFLFEVEHLKRLGLARGGSLENAIVIDGETILNPGGLRFQDEFVRHKLLDCIGDFSLIGMPIIGRLVTHRSGHAFNHAFLGKFFSSKFAWTTQTLSSVETAAPPAKPLAI